MDHFLMLAMVGLTFVKLAQAGSPVGGAPEIDPSSGAAAIAALAGTILVIRARRKR